MASAVGGMLEEKERPELPAEYFQIDDLSGATDVSPVLKRILARHFSLATRQWHPAFNVWSVS